MAEVQEVFEKARDFIRSQYNLELSLIEAKRLREDYVVPIVELINSGGNTKGSWAFDPDTEAGGSFMRDYYSAPTNDVIWVASFSYQERKALKEHLRRFQERAHMP